jgi:hypothetical protein
VSVFRVGVGVLQMSDLIKDFRNRKIVDCAPPPTNTCVGVCNVCKYVLRVCIYVTQ